MTRRMRIDDLLALSIPSQPAISPDGTRIAYVVGGADADADRAVSALWLTDVAGAARQLTHGTADTAPAFSPDGRTLAFQRDGQLWILPLDGGEPQQLTHLALGAGSPVWSPDSAKIAFSAPVDVEGRADDTDDDRSRRSGSPIVADVIDYQVDGTGFIRGIRTQVHVVEVASRDVLQLTDGDVHAGAPAWSPDGTALAYPAKPKGADDLVYRSAVHVLDPADPAAPPRLVAFEDGYAGTVSYTPDGSSLLVVGWPAEPDGHAGLYRVDLASGETTDLAGSLDRNVMPGAPAYPGALPQVTDAGDVLFAIRDRGCTHLYAVPVTGGEPRHVHGGDAEVVSGLSVAGGIAAIALATATSFGEIVRLDLASGESAVVTAQGSAPDDVSASRATASTTAAASWSGSSDTRAMPRVRAPRRSTPRSGSAASTCSRSGTRCRAPSSASCGSRTGATTKS